MVRVRFVGLIALVALAGAAGWYLVIQRSPAQAASESVIPSTIPVTAGKAVAQNIPIYLQELGTVQANYTVTVRTRVDGQIMEALFKEGQEVKAGDRLFQIDPRPFQAALEQAEANKQKDQAQLEGAQRDLDRYSKLVGPGYQTRQAYDDERATVAELQGAVKSDQAQIDAAQLNLVYADVRSPIDGRTGARLVDPGNFVQAAQATSLVSVTQLKPIFVTFTAPQESFETIRASQAKAPLAVEAYSGDGKTLLATGTLTLINNQIDVTTGTIQLKASYPNLDERLWPGEFVNVRLITSTRKNAITVPATTVMQGPSGDYAYLIKPDNTVQRVDIDVATIQDGIAIIKKGIAAGDEVVVDGQYRLTDGTKVQIDPMPTSSAQGS